MAIPSTTVHPLLGRDLSPATILKKRNELKNDNKGD